ncbi:MAG: TetR family transcriptional regulator [Myxococcales bacterium]|nr:TetR family transcriptional regulator [Myxococcales bacterium]
MSANDSLPTDGRRLRAVRTRANILDALLELLDEGHPEPTAAEIAERAGVAVRSIAQHFQTREQLLRALAEKHLARQPSPDGIDTSLPFSQRLSAFVSRRAAALEASVPMRRVARMAEGRSRAIAAAFREVGRVRRKELQDIFGAELARRQGWTLEAADGVTSGAFWDALREGQRLSDKRAREVLEATLRVLLGS